ncbi:MAG: hypothetical protein PHY82_08500 [Lentisphaeria bacterium]|nr:hypothetical protein [Lentisphaeria bacterium]
MNPPATLRLGIAQICAHPEPEKNLLLLEDALHKLSDPGVNLAVFPEYCLSLGSFQSMLRHAKTLQQWQIILGKLCSEQHLAAVFGGVTIEENGQYFNAALAFSAKGRLLARYDKRHLFRLNNGKKHSIDESSLFTPGSPAPLVFQFQRWKIALTICFDLRFPVFWQSAQPHPDLYLCPAAFTHATGKDHWLPLLQARAIENLSWVAGIGQCGSNSETGLELHGHSAVFNPWGQSAGGLFHREPGFLCIELDQQVLRDSRKRLPVCPFTAAVKEQELSAACRR